MRLKAALFAWILAVALAAPAAVAESHRAIRVAPPNATFSVDEKTRAAFRDAVEASVANAGFVSERNYTAFPTLVQLRRYLEPGQTQPTLVCLVSIAVSDEKSVLIATVRGSATAVNAASGDVIEVASSSAVGNLVRALESAERQKRKPSARD
jgi:hypothetical protein